MNIPVHHVAWKPCWRIIPTRFPQERLFDRVTQPQDRGVVDAVEQMTDERAKGPGADNVMVAFTSFNPEGSRFSDGTFGVYYAAKDMDTAVAESRFHRERFMKRTKEGPTNLEMRVLTASLAGRLHDLRGLRRSLRAVYSATGYAASQKLGARLRREGSSGIAYQSIRRPGGECAAVLRAAVLSACRPQSNLIYQWDGEKIAKVFDVRER